jgi:diguanylate cyclase (GGDEF)-like protein
MLLDLARRARGALPEGVPLPEQAWRQRHGVILWVLALHAGGVFWFGVVRGFGPAHSLVEAAPLALAAWLASLRWLSRRLRAGLATFGLLTASAVLVHLSGGLTEVHFHFFVMLFVITLYQDWATFLLAIAFVGVDHGVVGLLDPHAVYSHAEAWRSPLKWAGVHALFVAGASVAAAVNWGLTEKAQAGQRALADQLAYQASHDPLTGVLNRREFERCVGAALAKSRSQHLEHVLCLLDLDRFKIINDTCGHVAGDTLLRQLTTVLQNGLRSGDSLARLGGDEFGILLESCPLDRGRGIAEALREAVAETRFTWEQHTFSIGASFGVVAVTPYTASVDEAVRTADAACYTAKGKGRNRVHVHQPGDGELSRSQGESQWAGRILAAIREHRLELFYQTIVPVRMGGRAGEFVELLLRLRDEDGVLVPPGAFLPAAERYDLLPAIDRWVVATGFRALAGRYQAGRDPGGDLYSINLSGASIGDEAFLPFVRAQFAEHRVPPELICFELTETVAIGNLGVALRFINELRALGCRFALDDFGSGLSSFAYLKNLPVDFLKVDGHFVRGIAHDSIDRAMVEAVNRIGHEMGLRTIAEFVETDAVLDCLRELGVDYAQGYAISRPRPLAERMTVVAPAWRDAVAGPGRPLPLPG